MFYDKKIKYLNYIVSGERLKGCGFVKMEIRGECLNLEIAVSGLPSTVYVYVDVWLCAGGATYPLGRISLENGGGNFRLVECNIAEVSPIGVAYRDWEGICIFPDEGCEISAYWGEKSSCRLERVEVSEELAGSYDAEALMLEQEQAHQTPEEPEATPYVQKEQEAELYVQEVPEEPETESPVQEEVVQHTVLEKTDEQKRQLRLAEDKWEQISGIYPHIRPFRDKREYLSIRPADFVLLSEMSYKAVNNSFLMHGYYNYQHLILAKTVKKGEVSYYVGAPGNFYQREKQVAIMFGFTGFECAKDPAREGDFGYYLMEVQL